VASTGHLAIAVRSKQVGTVSQRDQHIIRHSFSPATLAPSVPPHHSARSRRRLNVSVSVYSLVRYGESMQPTTDTNKHTQHSIPTTTTTMTTMTTTTTKRTTKRTTAATTTTTTTMMTTTTTTTTTSMRSMADDNANVVAASQRLICGRGWGRVSALVGSAL